MKRIIALLILSLTLFSFGTGRSRADEIALAQTVQAGLTAQYALEIHNDTGAEHSYRLAMSGLPNTLTATFTQGGPVLDNVIVPASSYGRVTLWVAVPADTPVGHYAAQFTAARDDGTTLVHPVTLNVENTYALSIVGQNINVTTFSGQEFSFEATAANTGAAPVTNLTLKVDAPAKWVTQVDPPVVAQLEAGASVNFTARVLIPASQITLDQTVSLTAASDQVSSPESKLVVRVQQNPNYLIAAGVVMAVAVAGVFIYFRIKGRR